MKDEKELTQEQLDRFVALVSGRFGMRKAAEEIGTSLYYLMKRREVDPEFDKAWDSALAASWAEAEEVAQRLAIEGEQIVPKKVIDQEADPDNGIPEKSHMELVRINAKVLLSGLKAYSPRFRDQLGLNLGGAGQVDVSINLTPIPKPAPAAIPTGSPADVDVTLIPPPAPQIEAVPVVDSAPEPIETPDEWS